MTTGPEAIIRPARRDDLPTLVEVYNHYVTSSHVSFDTEPLTVAIGGHGEKLYSALLAELETEDLHRAFAGIAMPNPGSVALHKKLGFKQLGTFREVGQKFGKYWDVAWFQRSLRRE